MNSVQVPACWMYELEISHTACPCDTIKFNDYTVSWEYSGEHRKAPSVDYLETNLLFDVDELDDRSEVAKFISNMCLAFRNTPNVESVTVDQSGSVCIKDMQLLPAPVAIVKFDGLNEKKILDYITDSPHIPTPAYRTHLPVNVSRFAKFTSKTPIDMDTVEMLLQKTQLKYVTVPTTLMQQPARDTLLRGLPKTIITCPSREVDVNRESGIGYISVGTPDEYIPPIGVASIVRLDPRYPNIMYFVNKYNNDMGIKLIVITLVLEGSGVNPTTQTSQLEELASIVGNGRVKKPVLFMTPYPQVADTLKSAGIHVVESMDSLRVAMDRVVELYQENRMIRHKPTVDDLGDQLMAVSLK